MEIPIDANKSGRLWFLAVGGCALVVCLVVLVVSALINLFKTESGNNAFEPTLTAESTRGIGRATRLPVRTETSGPNALGDPQAPVTVIEYADYQCPFCASFWSDTQKKIVQNYVETGKVHFIYHSMGDFIGPESGKAAEAAYCAADQGKFWDYHDLLYSKQGGENVGAFSDDNLAAFAGELNLDVGQFTDCLRTGKYTARVSQEQIDGRAAGVRGTPSFVINGTLIEGAIPYEEMAGAIEDALAGK
jgi:protein-disulfide isomerase